MRKAVLLFLSVLLTLLSACGGTAALPEPTPEPAASIPETVSVTAPTISATLPPEPEATASPPQPEVTASPPQPVIALTEEEAAMLLKIGMAERGSQECTECIALVMRTVLNRVESNRFGSSIRSVILAQDQFTPVSDGTYYTAQPNERCQEALEMVIYGWDESQGALFYEWCEGESWHSKNLHLLFQHCDTRFYD